MCRGSIWWETKNQRQLNWGLNGINHGRYLYDQRNTRETWGSTYLNAWTTRKWRCPRCYRREEQRWKCEDFICRMPEIVRVDMVQCSKRSEWFHVHCMCAFFVCFNNSCRSWSCSYIGYMNSSRLIWACSRFGSGSRSYWSPLGGVLSCDLEARHSTQDV